MTERNSMAGSEGLILLSLSRGDRYCQISALALHVNMNRNNHCWRSWKRRRRRRREAARRSWRKRWRKRSRASSDGGYGAVHVFLSLRFIKSIFLEAAISPLLKQAAHFSGTERAKNNRRVTKVTVCSYPMLKNLRDGSVQMVCGPGSHMLDALGTILYRHGPCQETARKKKKTPQEFAPENLLFRDKEKQREEVGEGLLLAILWRQ